jgi:hypothetical protein
MAVAGSLLWVLIAPATKVPLTVDEGQHLVGARHILYDSHYLVRHQRQVGAADGEAWEHEMRTYPRRTVQDHASLGL